MSWLLRLVSTRGQNSSALAVHDCRSCEVRHNSEQHSENHILHTLLATQPPLLSGYSVALFPLAISFAYSQARAGPWYALPLLSERCPIEWKCKHRTRRRIRTEAVHLKLRLTIHKIADLASYLVHLSLECRLLLLDLGLTIVMSGKLAFNVLLFLFRFLCKMRGP